MDRKDGVRVKGGNQRLPVGSPRVAVAAIAIAVVGFALWIGSVYRGRGLPLSDESAKSATPTSEAVHPPDLRSSETSRETITSPDDPAIASGETARSNSAAAPIEEPNSVRSRLSTAIELSVSGALDPTAILKAGASLAQLHIEKGDLPLVGPDGSLRYPLASCPSGVHAELWVQRSSDPRFENVVALRMRVDAPAEPYLLEGAIRKDPVAQVQAFLDKSGRIKDLVIMTDLAPSGESRSFGLPVLQGKIPQGVMFHADMDRPEAWTAQSYGLDNGVDSTWDHQVALLGEPWPDPAALTELGTGLLGLLSEARH